MTYRFEDRGLTLRLFVSERDALAYPNARDPMRYATGWIAKNENGSWIDGDGVLPQNWQPHPAFLVPDAALTGGVNRTVERRCSACGDTPELHWSRHDAMKWVECKCGRGVEEYDTFSDSDVWAKWDKQNDQALPRAGRKEAQL